MVEIKIAVASGAPFYCHKTVKDDGWDEDGEWYSAMGSERVCGGSVQWLRNGGDMGTRKKR